MKLTLKFSSFFAAVAISLFSAFVIIAQTSFYKNAILPVDKEFYKRITFKATIIKDLDDPRVKRIEPAAVKHAVLFEKLSVLLGRVPLILVKKIIRIHLVQLNAESVPFHLRKYRCGGNARLHQGEYPLACGQDPGEDRLSYQDGTAHCSGV